MDKILTPQQEAFLSYYTNPKSETFSNAKQSALKAGYEETYANNITGLMPDWLFDNIGDLKMLKKAEKVLDSTLEMEDMIVDDKGQVKRDTAITKIKQDSAKFVASTMGKTKYSTKGEEATDKLADNIKTLIINKQYGNDNKPV